MSFVLAKMRSKNGQGTLEYIIIAVIVVGLAVLIGKLVKPKAEKNIEEIASGLSQR